MEHNTFLELIAINQGIIHKICRLYRDTQEDRQDLFQEIVYQLWRSVDNFRHQAKPSTFIYRIAINTAISSLRKDTTKKMIEYTDQLPEMIQTNEDRDIFHRKNALISAIKMLNEADRAIIMLVLEDVPYKDIAEIIGTSENNTAVKINRIKNKLRTLLNT